MAASQASRSAGSVSAISAGIRQVRSASLTACAPAASSEPVHGPAPPRRPPAHRRVDEALEQGPQPRRRAGRPRPPRSRSPISQHIALTPASAGHHGPEAVGIGHRPLRPRLASIAATRPGDRVVPRTAYPPRQQRRGQSSAAAAAAHDQHARQGQAVSRGRAGAAPRASARPRPPGRARRPRSARAGRCARRRAFYASSISSMSSSSSSASTSGERVGRQSTCSAPVPGIPLADRQENRDATRSPAGRRRRTRPRARVYALPPMTEP